MIKKSIILAACAFILAGCGTTTDNAAPQQPLNGNPRDEQAAGRDTAASAVEIRLTSPQPGQVLKSPFLIGGEAKLPDDTVYVRVKNKNNETLISEQTRIKAEPETVGPFGVLISFRFESTNAGIVEVYGIDAKTGNEVSITSVDVSFDISGSGSAEVE